jgi:16S rRNA (uracil1498-N3)-methyltransferase
MQSSGKRIADKIRYTPPVVRRVHVHQLQVGTISLKEGEAHHLRNVLRLQDGDLVELFDEQGRVARGKVKFEGPTGVRVQVDSLLAIQDRSFQLVVASAVPKGDRADWMIEKLSELGVDRFIPLATERSVVLPTGTGKRQRWERLAIESAKQSHRPGVMRIDELTPLAAAIGTGSETPGWYLSTEAKTQPIGSMLALNLSGELRLFIGPEGGWTDAERTAFAAAGLTGVGLTDTILRIETAAITAAAVVLCHARGVTKPVS